jgi:hypothetical protein
MQPITSAGDHRSAELSYLIRHADSGYPDRPVIRPMNRPEHSKIAKNGTHREKWDGTNYQPFRGYLFRPFLRLDDSRSQERL